MLFRNGFGSPPPLRGRSASKASREGGHATLVRLHTPHPNPPPHDRADVGQARHPWGREHTVFAASIVATLLLVVLIGGGSDARAQSPQFTPRDEAPEDFPAGAGRDETFHSCTACHNFKLVAAQGMSRRQWEESIALMVAKHGMHALDDKDRTIVLDYLEATFPPRAPSGGWQNPFLKP